MIKYRGEIGMRHALHRPRNMIQPKTGELSSMLNGVSQNGQ
jgi:hypothetical protein